MACTNIAFKFLIFLLLSSETQMQVSCCTGKNNNNQKSFLSFDNLSFWFCYIGSTWVHWCPNSFVLLDGWNILHQRLPSGL